jgi:hypothetical protein
VALAHAGCGERAIIQIQDAVPFSLNLSARVCKLSDPTLCCHYNVLLSWRSLYAFLYGALHNIVGGQDNFPV